MVCVLRRWAAITGLTSAAVVAGTTPLLGYLSFWIFLASKPAGRLFSYAVYAATAAVLVVWGRRAEFWRVLRLQVSLPFTFVVASAALYLSLFWLYGDGGHREGLAERRFFEELRPGDDLIPLIFADKLYSRQPLHPFCCGDWLSSDRPPLQTGVTLLVLPLRVTSIGATYQIAGTLLQCLAFAAGWRLLLALSVSRRTALQAITLLILCAFFFYNSVYVWPKLLAGAFILFALAIFFSVLRQQEEIKRSDAVFGGLCLGLAFLAHPGSVFSLPAFLAVAAWHWRLFPLRSVLAGIAPILLLLFSWTAYQRWIDPPGNRLTKMHLAGVFDIDSRTLPEALRDSYLRRTWAEIARNKESNLKQVIGTDPLFRKALIPGEGARILQREYIWNSMGLLTAGWLVAVAAIFSRALRARVQPMLYLLAAVIVNLLLWCLILFGPEGTFTTESSYGDLLILGLSLATLLLATLPRPITWALAGWETYHLYVVWAAARPGFLDDARMQSWLLSGAAATTVMLLWFGLVKPSLQPDREGIAHTEHALLPAR